MRAGDLRHQITIQRFSQTQDEMGGIVEDWADLFTIRASIQPLSSKEMFNSQTLITETTHRVFMRYQDVKPNDRLLFNGRIFDITAVINRDEKKVSLELLCKEIF